MKNEKIFLNNDERKALGGTGFHEIQFCEKNLPIKKLLKIKNIRNWASNSLYIEALSSSEEIFYNRYNTIFSQFGNLDYYGINYFTTEQTEKILYDLKNQDLPDKNILIEWLEICIKNYNGFYFLGI